MPFEVGQIASDYEILSILGKGGMGCVYRVRNVISNRVEAMKVLLADVAAEAELGDRFLGEIRTLARLDHPNIAKFHTAFKVENQLVMVMEFVEGVTLTEYHKKGGLVLDDALSYVGQTLSALSYAHANGVIHRDIKPSNIMVTPHGIAKLMDFGIAKSNIDPLLTRPGTTMGSMLYMSPEQVRGTTVDARSDIYSVGVMLYELTAGRRPFEAENTFGILDAQLNAAPKPPIELNPALPSALNEIILTALNKEPMRRFQTAEAFRNALDSLRAPRVGSPKGAVPTAAAPLTPILNAKKPNRGLWMALGAAACVGVLVAGAVMLPHFFKSAAATTGNKTQMTEAPVNQPVTVPAVTNNPSPASPQSANPPLPPQPTTTQQPTTQVTPAGNQIVSQNLRQTVKQPTPRIARTTVPVQNPPMLAPGLTPVPTPQTQTQPPPPAGPSQRELDAVGDSLSKLHARADSVRGSLQTLRSQQAAQGTGLRQDISASASRMDSYLSAADRALQSGNLDAARRSMDRADEEINKLEAFFGR